MKKLVLALVIMLLLFSISAIYGNRKLNSANSVISSGQVLQEPIVSKAILSAFFKKYPYLKDYESEVNVLYKNRKYTWIWHDKEGLIEFADLLYSKANRLEEEGLEFNLPYKDEIDSIFDRESTKKLSKTDTEILLSSMYVYYAEKVYKGIETEKITETGWFIPRKKLSYANLLDSLLVDSKLLNKNEDQLLGQYYKLREALKKYRRIEQNGGWNTIKMDPFIKDYKPNDSSKVIGQIRKRLIITGDLKKDSNSN